MVTIFDVLCKKEDNFFVIINEAGNHTRMYGSSLNAGTAITAAGMKVEYKPAMTVTDYKRQYNLATLVERLP